MTQQALKIVDLLQFCLQGIALLSWLVKRSPNHMFTFAVGSPVFLVFWGAPVAFFVVALVGVQPDLWLGLGESTSTWVSGVSMAFVALHCGIPLFDLGNPDREVDYRLWCESIVGMVVLTLAVGAAGLQRPQVGRAISGLGLSYIQHVCSWLTDERNRIWLSRFILAIGVSEVMLLVGCFLVALFRNRVIAGSEGISEAVWSLSQVGFWGQAFILIISHIWGNSESEKTLLPSAGSCSKLPTRPHSPEGQDTTTIGAGSGGASSVIDLDLADLEPTLDDTVPTQTGASVSTVVREFVGYKVNVD